MSGLLDVDEILGSQRANASQMAREISVTV